MRSSYLLHMLLQIAHSALAAVVLDQPVHRVLLKLHIRVLQACALLRLRGEVAGGNYHLFLEHVARDLHHLHAVEQGGGDRVKRVGRADEEEQADALPACRRAIRLSAPSTGCSRT